jgi:hypothetical protein
MTNEAARLPRVVFRTACCLAGVFALIGCGGNGRAPSNVRLEADTDSTVKVLWSVPVDATPDKYLVYFRPAAETAYSLVAETTANVWVHDPKGATGWYRVEAEYGTETYAASMTTSTVPVRTDTLALVELSAPGDAGFGWDRRTGRGMSCSMTDIRNSGSADFYVTDFRPAPLNLQPYAIASPDMGPSDPANVVPTGTWRVSVFTDSQPEENVLLPALSPTSYFNYADISNVPCSIGCCTADSHYALIKVVSVDGEDRRVVLETWYQLLPGLRLTRH